MLFLNPHQITPVVVVTILYIYIMINDYEIRTEYHPNYEFHPRVDVEKEHQIYVYEYAQRGR